MAVKRTCGFTNISTSPQLVPPLLCRVHYIYRRSSIHSWNYLFSFLPFAVQILNKNTTKVSFLEGYYIFISKIWVNIRGRFNRHDHYNIILYLLGGAVATAINSKNDNVLKFYNFPLLHHEVFLKEKNIITRDNLFK